MIRVTLLLTILFVLTSCATFLPSHSYWAEYETTLEEVERPADSRDRWGEVEGITPTDSAGYTYSDELVDVVIALGMDGIYFSVTNVSEHTIRLVWDEAAYVGPDGSVDRVMHYGVKYADRNSSWPPSVIPRGGRLEDGAFPSRKVEFASAGIESDWVHHALLAPDQTTLLGPVTGPSAEDFRRRARENVGRRIGLLLPLEVEGTLNEYTFWFRVTGVRFNSGPSGVDIQEEEGGWVRFEGAPFDMPTWAGFVAMKGGNIAYPLIPTCTAWYHLREDEAQFIRTMENVRRMGLSISDAEGCRVR